MAIYVVMEPPGRFERAQATEFVRDGFHWLGFLVPPLWLLWYRLWVEALLAFVAAGLLAALGEFLDLGLTGTLLTLLVSIYVGLEGPAMRIAALRRRGWREWGVVEADTLDDADARYALETDALAEGVPTQRIVPDASLARPAQTGLALGLAHYPGKP